MILCFGVGGVLFSYEIQRTKVKEQKCEKEEFASRGAPVRVFMSFSAPQKVQTTVTNHLLTHSIILKSLRVNNQTSLQYQLRDRAFHVGEEEHARVSRTAVGFIRKIMMERVY